MARILFKTFDEIKAYVGTADKLDLRTLEGFAHQAAQRYIVKAIGRECYEWLLSAYVLGTLDAGQRELLPLVQRPLAFYTILEAAPTLQVRIGEVGIVEPSAEHVTGARQASVSSALESLLASGDFFVDELLAFLEARKSTYPLWANSAAARDFSGSVIRTAAELTDYVNIQGSRQTFQALRPYMRDAHEMGLQQVLGTALYTELMAALAAGNATAAQLALASKCRPYVAHATVAEAVVEISLLVTDSGLKVLTKTDGIFSKLQPSDTAIAAVRKRHTDKADVYRAMLVQYLEANASLFPLYPAAPAGSTPASFTLPDNPTTSKSFIL